MGAFKNTLKSLENTKLPLERKQKLDTDIRIMLAVLEKADQIAQKAGKVAQKPLKSQKGSETKRRIPKMVNCNPLYPSCSKAVEIKDDGGDIGRHAVAAKNIEPGEILVIETPHCAFLLAEHRCNEFSISLSRDNVNLAIFTDFVHNLKSIVRKFHKLRNENFFLPFVLITNKSNGFVIICFFFSQRNF